MFVGRTCHIHVHRYELCINAAVFGLGVADPFFIFVLVTNLFREGLVVQYKFEGHPKRKYASHSNMQIILRYRTIAGQV